MPGRTVEEITRSLIGCFAVIEVMAMILPHFLFRICGSTSRIQRMVLIRLSVIPFSHIVSSRSGKDATGGPPAADASELVIGTLVASNRHRVGDARTIRALVGRGDVDDLRAL